MSISGRREHFDHNVGDSDNTHGRWLTHSTCMGSGGKPFVSGHRPRQLRASVTSGLDSDPCLVSSNGHGESASPPQVGLGRLGCDPGIDATTLDGA